MARKVEIKKFNHDTLFEIKHRNEAGVILDEITIEGTMVDQKCKECGQALIHASDYDAAFCPTCNEWLTPPCGPDCHCCGNRPERPLDKWPKGY